MPVPQIAKWHDGRYVPNNMVVAAAGSLDHDRIVALVDAAFGDAAPAPVADPAEADASPAVRFHAKETEQYHLALGGLGIARGDERRFAMRILDTILGGSTSSRLFQEVREKRGLAYSVYSYTSQYADTGQVAVYVGTRPDNVQEAMTVIGTELSRLQSDGVTAAELDRARENVKGRTVLSMESSASRMNRLGSSVLMGVPLLTVDELLARLDAVTLDDVTQLAATSGSRAHVGGRRGRRRGDVPLGARGGQPGARRSGVINVAVSGAAGRMGETVCRAVEGAEDMALVGRADPLLETGLPTCSATPTWWWTSPRPTRPWRTRAPAWRRECTA